MKKLKVIKKTNILAVITLIVVFISCQKNEIEMKINSKEVSKFTIKNNLMVFKDSMSFVEYYNYILQNQNRIDEINFDLNNRGFKSLYQASLKYSLDGLTKNPNPKMFHLEKIDSSIFIDLIVPNFLAIILNENGMVQIGEKIMRITYNYTFICDYKNNESLKILLEDEDNLLMNKNILSVKNKRSSLNDRYEYSYRTEYFDSKHRLVARLDQSYIGLLYLYVVRSTTQKKGIVGIWTQENVSYILASYGSGSATLSCGGNSQIQPFGMSYNNSSDVQTAVQLLCPAVNSASSCLASHVATRSGKTVSITNNQIFK